MPVVHQFAYGLVNPVVAYLMSFIGSVLGLTCTARARIAPSRARRVRWLALGSVSLGGAGVWLMHFMATLGFDIPSRTIRYDGLLTIASLLIPIAAVAAGVFIVGWGRVSIPKILLGGLITGLGLMAMHETGLAAIDFDGHIRLSRTCAVTALVIAVATGTVMLWCTASVRGWKATAISSGIIAAALCAMHYVGMSGTSVRVDANGPGRPPRGIDPILLALPITVVTTVVLMMALLFSALSMMTDEEFAGSAEISQRRAAPAVPVPMEVVRAHGYTHGQAEFDADVNAALRSQRAHR
jgi:NO-binding membrane sensor protein with MHYT domain